jgi:hypothetical protein
MHTLFCCPSSFKTRMLWALTRELRASLIVGVWYLCAQRLKMIPSLPILRASIRASLYTMPLSTYHFKFVHIHQKDWCFSLWTPTIQSLEIREVVMKNFSFFLCFVNEATKNWEESLKKQLRFINNSILLRPCVSVLKGYCQPLSILLEYVRGSVRGVLCACVNGPVFTRI